MSKAEIPTKSPIGIDVEAGKSYFWCSCGKAKNQPLCDGSHKGSTFVPVKFTATESKRVSFCGCKQTKTPSMCDGSHGML